MKLPKVKPKHSYVLSTKTNSMTAISGSAIAMRKRGYSTAQIRNRIKLIIRLKYDELREVYEDANATILERIIANALKKDIDKGEMTSLEKLLSRVFSISKGNNELKDDFFDKIEITYVTKKIDEIEIPE